MEETKTDIVQDKIGRADVLASRIEALITEARAKVVSFVNTAMVYTYYEIGRMIVEDEQGGEERAEYGKNILKKLSAHLSNKFGKGYSVDNLQNMRNFYMCYSKYETLSRISSDNNNIPHFTLSWSHYLKLMRISNPAERDFYEIEAAQNQLEDENPTVGLLLCADKENSVVEYTLPLNNNQIFAAKYETVLPSKEELKKLISNR